MTIETYLEEKRPLWKEVSYRANKSRLKHHRDDFNASRVYTDMQEKYKPYYIKITFITLASYAQWLVEKGFRKDNPYDSFMKRNNQLFRNAYEDVYSTITWEEYQDELLQPGLSDDVRTALALLGYGGCRLSELHTFDGRTVMGKGSKRRPVYLPVEFISKRVSLSKDQIRRAIRHNPHSYRKLAADAWFRGGIDLKTVQTLLGHTSIVSTQRYLRPMAGDQINNKLQVIWGNDK